MKFEEMNAMQRRLHNAAIVLDCDGDEYGFTDLLREAIGEIERLRANAERYAFLRGRDLDTITAGGVFAGMTPRNVALNGEDLDEEVDAAMLKTPNV